jgi:hypothetical protein
MVARASFCSILRFVTASLTLMCFMAGIVDHRVMMSLIIGAGCSQAMAQ